MITLYQFEPFWGLPNTSPFCMKLEAYLRLRSIPYRVESITPSQAVCRRLPYIARSDDIYCDAQAIIEMLESEYDVKLDDLMSPRQCASAAAWRDMIETRLYRQITFMRWADPYGWENFYPEIRRAFPRIIGEVPLRIMRRRLLRKLSRQGLKSYDTIAAYMEGYNVLDRMADFLGERQFVMGNFVTTLDLTFYAFLANIIEQPHSNPLQRHAQSHENLVLYCQRMKIICFGAEEQQQERRRVMEYSPAFMTR